MSKPKVSILCITYNHAKYIRDALDGFVMQKTTFPFEVLIHDDASTDGTADIIREYEKKYPDIIKPIYQTENKWSKGVQITQDFLWPNIQGEYVAINEGDDYWTDENKLQKQVDFLDNNPEYTICFHNVKRIFETGIQENDIYPTEEVKKRIDGYDFKNLLVTNFIQTNSAMYRWNAIENIAKKFPKNILPGDYYLHLMFAKVGKIKFLEDVMSVYRINDNGIWYDAYKEPNRIYLKFYLGRMNFAKEVYKNILDNNFLYIKFWITYYNKILKSLKEGRYYKQFCLFILLYGIRKEFYCFCRVICFFFMCR